MGFLNSAFVCKCEIFQVDNNNDNDDDAVIEKKPQTTVISLQFSFSELNYH